MNEAEVELNRFAQNYPSEQATVKDLRRKIFSFGGATAHTTVETPKRTRIGFNSPQSESNTEDEFFAIPETPKRAKQNMQQKRTNSITPKKTDDFFENNSNRVGDHQPTKRTTNDDFNF